jgi:hypothetical protein
VQSVDKYSSGQNRFRFQVLRNSQGFLCGIISKDTSIQSFTSVLYDRIMTRRVMTCSSGYGNSQNVHDFYVFNVTDRDRLLISLENERTGNKREFNTNVNTCLFLWRIVLGHFYAGSFVRLC